MKQIITVQGAINPEELSFCQCHEHLAISKGVSFQKNPVLLIDDLKKNTQEASRLVQAGGSLVVDAQPGGCNRIETMLYTISRDSGLHIIASCGFHKLCFYPKNHWIFRIKADSLYQFFLDELTHGMYSNIDTSENPYDHQNFTGTTCTHTQLRAGIVKMALDQENLSPRYRTLFIAGAKAAIQADVPVMIHIESGSDPVALFHFLKDLGIAPKRMIFCHMDRAIPDLAVHRQLLSEGIFLEYDTIGRFKYHSDLHEIEIFKTMMEAGYEKQLLFSLDTTRARLKSYDTSAIGLDYLLKVFVPLMKEHGITSKQIGEISHNNFIRAFTG